MNDVETLKAIGNLIRAARTDLGESQAKFADRAGINPKTLWSAETGDRLSQDVNQRKIERALGWRARSIADIWADRADLKVGQLTMADMHSEKRQQPGRETDVRGHVGTAQSLTDEELLAEISYRFRRYKTAVPPAS